MEINRKKLSDEIIREKETQTIDDINATTEEYAAKFAELGYELNVDMYYMESEYDRLSHELSDDNEVYTPGYVSQAKITVRKIGEAKPDENETAEDDADGAAVEVADGPDDGADEEDYDKLEAIVEENAEKLERSFAYTIVMMLRIYKSFWKEIVEFCDGMEMLRADLDDFLANLADEADQSAKTSDSI